LDGKKNTHIRNQRCNISPFFAWLYAEELIDRNPCAAVKPIKVPEEEKKAFSSEEIDTIRGACKDVRERAVIEMLLSSGLRVAELCSLKKEDIDLAELTVKVKCGKGGKDRTTFINPVARKHIVAYLRDNKHDSEYLFTTRAGKNYTPGGIRYITDVLEKRTGIHIHPHRFRRTLATDLSRKGMAIQEIQKLLGHTSIETTRKYIETQADQVEASYRQYVA
jgi:site-specific recombinase XerD